jgi:hypothetical protein
MEWTAVLACLFQGKKIKETRYTFHKYYTLKELENIFYIVSISFIPFIKMFHLGPSPPSLIVYFMLLLIVSRGQ